MQVLGHMPEQRSISVKLSGGQRPTGAELVGMKNRTLHADSGPVLQRDLYTTEWVLADVEASVGANAWLILVREHSMASRETASALAQLRSAPRMDAMSWSTTIVAEALLDQALLDQALDPLPLLESALLLAQVLPTEQPSSRGVTLLTVGTIAREHGDLLRPQNAGLRGLSRSLVASELSIKCLDTGMNKAVMMSESIEEPESVKELQPSQPSP